jgi:uncharacterized protein (TIGR02186 family)
MILRAALIAALALAAHTARAERLTIALSTPEVQISPNFTGATITVLGVIEGDDPGEVANEQYEVAVVVLGPSQTVVARRKDRVVGIWVNSAGETFIDVPSVYVLDTSGELDAIAPSTTLQRLSIGFDNIAFTYPDSASRDHPEAAEFRAAYVRLKERAGLFSENPDIEFISTAIFRSTARLPANIPVGRYTVLAYLFSGGTLIARTEDTIVVSKTGFEQALASFASGHSMIYGLLCGGLAIFVGWLGGVIFRRD